MDDGPVYAEDTGEEPVGQVDGVLRFEDAFTLLREDVAIVLSTNDAELALVGVDGDAERADLGIGRRRLEKIKEFVARHAAANELQRGQHRGKHATDAGQAPTATNRWQRTEPG